MSSVLKVRIPTAEVYLPLLDPSARYLGAEGGRGSGKSHFFAGLAADRGITPGTRGLCVREVQKSLRESAKRLIEDKVEQLKLPGFRLLNDRTETPGGGMIAYVGMQDHTAEQIMSYEGLDWVWVEQAETLSARSLQILRPTVFRKESAQLWASWNPRRKSDPIDVLLRGDKPPGAVVVQANWSNNPWFPKTLNEEREFDLKHSASYNHIWEGAYATVVEGAYFAQYLTTAQQEGRITQLSYDPLAERRAYFDLGIDDAMAIWVVQFVGQRIHLMDYIEGTGQGLEYYVNELRSRGHEKAVCILPHDGANRSAITGARFSDHLDAAGFRTRIVPNQGRGAASIRIAALRRQFHRFWFNTPATDAGREALGSYHETMDETRQVGLGPCHDWSSHGSDAAGLMACDYEPPKAQIAPMIENVLEVDSTDANAAWMA